jgi:hypothetical protein
MKYLKIPDIIIITIAIIEKITALFMKTMKDSQIKRRYYK